MPQLQECRRCEAPVPDGASFCHICGDDLGHDGPRDAHSRLRDRLSHALGERYRVLDVLGAGGMGVVFLAEDLEHDRKVAIKVLLPELAADANVVARFGREARTAASLDHPGIVRIHEAASDRGLHYFVMEYVEGRTLQELLLQQPHVPIAFVTRVLCEAAGALAHAHRRGIVHRDVKPENIMIDAKGRVLLADFGISKVSRAATGATTVQRLTETGGVLGTPHYMAPEHALGQAVDGRTDQYALAIVGFQMLAGRVPFDDETTPAIIHLHINTAAPRLSTLRPEVSPQLASAIARAMSKAPTHRFATMEEFAAAVAGATAKSPGAGFRASWALTMLLAGGLFAAGTWWMWQRSPADARQPVAAPASTKQPTVRLSITSSPTATVYIDGRRVGVTPIAGHPLSGAGRHHIRLERKGYRSTRDTINVTKAPTIRRNYVLRREGR